MSNGSRSIENSFNRLASSTILTVDLVMNGISDSVTMSYMKIGERSFEIFYISTADALGLCW